MQEPSIAIVILNTSRQDDTLACLTSIEKSDYRNRQVVVLDNASTDGSVQAICAQFPDTHIIELKKNAGYAGNNNVGIRAVMEMGAEWVLVLNEDTILAPDCLTEMMKIGQSDQKTGIVGPLVYHHNEPGVIQSAGGRLNEHWLPVHVGKDETDLGQYSQAREVDWVSGCAILLRREVIERIGLLDERFFYYWEETDWCIRARAAGWKIWYAPQAKLWHKGVQRDYQPSPNVTYYCTRNWFLLLSKHRAPASVWAYVYWWTVRCVVDWTMRPKWRSMRGHRDAMVQGTLDFIRQRWGMRTV